MSSLADLCPQDKPVPAGVLKHRKEVQELDAKLSAEVSAKIEPVVIETTEPAAAGRKSRKQVQPVKEVIREVIKEVPVRVPLDSLIQAECRVLIDFGAIGMNLQAVGLHKGEATATLIVKLNEKERLRMKYGSRCKLEGAGTTVVGYYLEEIELQALQLVLYIFCLEEGTNDNE